MEQDYDKRKWDTACPKYDCRKDSCKCGLEMVKIPAALGDDSADSNSAPHNGAYCNALVIYEANDHVYIYTKEGIPTLIDVDASDISTLEREVIKAQHDVYELTQDIDGFAHFFDSVADMKNFELENGDYAKTIGYYAKNDGGGAYYRIRNQRDGDNIDEKFLIAISDGIVAELITGHKVNILQVGGKQNFVDCCNYLIQGGYDIYVPYAEYTAEKQIVFDQDRTVFDCDGNITCTDQFTLFLVTGQKNTINLNGKVTGLVRDGKRRNVLMQIGGPNHPNSASYNNIFVEEALEFRKGFYLAPDGGGKGVAYNDIRFTHVQASTGIHYQAGQTGANWINENTFTGGRLEPNTYGIYFEKGGPDQWDPYNGNKFYHIAIEPSATYECGIKLDIGTHNYFERIRLSEGLGGDYYVEVAEGCRFNTFQNESRVEVGQFKDHNTDPAYYNYFQFSGVRDTDWAMVAKECYTVGGVTYVPDGFIGEIQKYFGEGYNSNTFNLHSNLTCNGMTLKVGNDYNNVDMVYTLPAPFGRFGVSEFILRVRYKGSGSTITLNWQNGETAISNDEINYQHAEDRFLCRYVNTGNNLEGKWLVTPLQ